MLSDADVQALVHARDSDPFSVLGLHDADNDGSLWVRAMLPGARAVSVCEVSGGHKLASLSLRDPAGLWEGRVVRRRNRFDYRLCVQWGEDPAEEQVYADAHSRGPLLSDDELYYLGEGSHLRPFDSLGALPMRLGDVDGVRFAVWAPNASRVSVVGSFNGWDGRRHPMRMRHGVGVWEIFIPHAALGDAYKYEIVSAAGHRLPLKSAPYARAAQYRPGTASIVSALPPAAPDAAGFEWIDADDAARSIFSWLRRDESGGMALVFSNFTPVPREAIRLGVPDGPWRWREVLNTDSAHYGGANLGNGSGTIEVEDVPCHGRGRSIRLLVPPLATLFLVPA